MTAPLEIRMLPIAELIPAPYNPRLKLKIHEPARRKLAASLREFGLVEPLVWNERTGHVVGGHARFCGWFHLKRENKRRYGFWENLPTEF